MPGHRVRLLLQMRLEQLDGLVIPPEFRHDSRPQHLHARFVDHFGLAERRDGLVPPPPSAARAVPFTSATSAGLSSFTFFSVISASLYRPPKAIALALSSSSK